MNVDLQLGWWVQTAVALIVAVPSIWAAVAAGSRSARLRLAEALWRQILDVEDVQDRRDRLVRELHRHTTAQLISRRLVPTDVFDLGSLLFLFAPIGTAAALLLGAMGAAIVIDGAATTQPWEVWAIAGGAFLGAAWILGGALLYLADVTNARHGIVSEVLAERPVSQQAFQDAGPQRLRRYRRTPRRFLRLAMIALGVGVTLAVAGVSAAFAAAHPGFAGGPHLRVVAGGLVVYALGLVLTRRAWSVLVEPLPPMHAPVSPTRSSSLDERPPDTADRCPASAAADTGTGAPPTGWRCWPGAGYLAVAALLAWWQLGRRRRDAALP